MQITIDKYKNLVDDLNKKFNISNKEKTNLKLWQNNSEKIFKLNIEDNNCNNYNDINENSNNNKIKIKNNFMEKIENLNFEEKEIIYRKEIKRLQDILETNENKIKREIEEKINTLREFENLRISQKEFIRKHTYLKNIVESTQIKIEESKFQIQDLISEKENILIKYNSNLIELEELRFQFSVIFQEHNKILEENSYLKEINDNTNFNNLDIFRKIDNLEQEKFNLYCKNNLLKELIMKIINLFLIEENNINVINLLDIDDNYIINSPEEIKIEMEKIFYNINNLFKKEANQCNTKLILQSLLQKEEENKILNEKFTREINLRRKIQNNNISSKEKLRIFCRIRPFLTEEELSVENQQYLKETFEISNNFVRIKDKDFSKKYKFEYVFDQNSLQKDIFEEFSGLIQMLFKGKNVSILSLGNSLSGKTYSMYGKSNEDQGLIFRSIEQICDLIEKMEDDNHRKNDYNNNKSNDFRHKILKKYKLSMSIIEINNENIINLLDESFQDKKNYENNYSYSNDNLIIPQINLIEINNYSEALKLIKLAKTLRKKFKRDNQDIFQSNLIYTIYLKTIEGEKVIRSRMNIIDFSSKETLLKKNENIEYNIRKEIEDNNLSLNSLYNVLFSLNNKIEHLPFRDSKFTHYLKESLSNENHIILLLHLTPNCNNFSKNLNILEFSHKIRKKILKNINFSKK
jgi:hypothetical protein